MEDCVDLPAGVETAVHPHDQDSTLLCAEKLRTRNESAMYYSHECANMPPSPLTNALPSSPRPFDRSINAVLRPASRLASTAATEGGEAEKGTPQLTT